MTHTYWAACRLTFFGFLRSSEFTVPAQDRYDPSVHLAPQDFTLDCRSATRIIQVRIKQSKTDPFRQGVNLYLGQTDMDICLVRALLPYLAARGNHPRPFFIEENGRMLTRAQFSAKVRYILTALYIDEGNYNTHSFHIGGQLQP